MSPETPTPEVDTETVERGPSQRMPVERTVDTGAPAPELKFTARTEYAEPDAAVAKREAPAVPPPDESVTAPQRTELEKDAVAEKTAAPQQPYEAERVGTITPEQADRVMDDSTDMVYQIWRLARFYAHESCAQCTQCREGTAWTTRILERILAGKGKQDDFQLLLDLSENMTGKTICVLSDSCAAPIVSGIQKFRSEFEAYIAGEREPALATV